MVDNSQEMLVAYESHVRTLLMFVVLQWKHPNDGPLVLCSRQVHSGLKSLTKVTRILEAFGPAVLNL